MSMIICPCGKTIKVPSCLVERKKYCSLLCKRKYARRKSGLKYNIKVVNPTWFKKGDASWNSGTIGVMKKNSGCFVGGLHKSIKTEFKYINGNGYRHLIEKGVIEDNCIMCGENNIKRLHIHHVDCNRKNNRLNNLIVLCRPCHLTIHGRTEKNYVEGRTIKQT